jgi:FKBP-type peptidyl-prolyl cis-trans isomerase FkpA
MKTKNTLSFQFSPFAKTRFFLFSLSVFCLLSSSLVSCTKTSTAEQDKKDDDAITSYLSQHSIDATKTSSGLYYSIEDLGTGMQVSSNNTVYMKYKAYLLDGTVFDENKIGTNITLPNTIKGWQEGIPKFKVGGKGKLFIPSKLGYGTEAVGKIPANSVLIFEVEVIEIK